MTSGLILLVFLITLGMALWIGSAVLLALLLGRVINLRNSRR